MIFDGNPGSSAGVDISDLQDVVWESERSASPEPFRLYQRDHDSMLVFTRQVNLADIHVLY